MSQNVKVFRTLEFYAQGGATKMSTIDTDDSATICYWRPETNDTGYLSIGSGTKDMDVKIFLGSATEYVLYDVGNSRVDYGEDSQGVDIRIFGDTASSLLLWDTSDDRLEFDGCDLNLQDSDILQFGDAQDVAITWDASNLTIIPATDNTGAIQIGNDGTKSMDLKLFGATASAYMEWDNSADRLNIVTVSGRAISGEEHAVDIVNGGTCSSGDSMVGLNVKTTASGTAASWVSGLFVNATQASKAVNGYLCAAEFELTSTAANASDNAVIVINSVRNHTGSPPAADPYILLREYGTTYADSLFRVFGDTGQGDQSTLSTTRVVTSVQAAYEANCDCAFRVVVGSTPIWILGSTTTPTS